MKKLILAAALIAGTTAAASAADMRMPTKAPMLAPAYSWAGWYIGAHAGYAWSSSSSTRYTGDAFTLALVAGGALPASYDVGQNGFTGGGQIGINWQAGAWVFGIEADLGVMDIGGDAAVVLVNPAGIPPYAAGNQWFSSASMDVDWVATVRGRVGLAMDRWMVFATGGIAFADISLAGAMSQAFPVGGPVFRTWAGSSSGIETGYVLGGGFEYAMTNNWLLRLEGLYYNFGDINDAVLANPANPAINVPAVMSRSTDLDMAVVRIGLNYKFGP